MTTKFPKVLLVDDSPTILHLLSLGLRQQGFEVVTAGDGLEALKLLSDHEVRALVTDINMPRLDGLRLIQAVRKEPRTAALPIVVLSTESESCDREAARSSGASLYLVKPVHPSELAAKLRELLA